MDHILATKLVTPVVPAHMVPRARLMRAADAPRLTLVSAPAGYGKTTLLAAWAAAAAIPTAWLSLDRLDNDPLRFLTHLIAAIQARLPRFSAHVVGTSGASSLPPMEDMMRALINHLCRLRESIFLILDDLHLVTDSTVHQAIAFLVEHQPPQLQLVIASRCDPPFSLARLRGQRQLLELRAADLRFMPEEIQAFLNDRMQLDLPPQQLDTLAVRTEGWIVGLQLAAVSIHAVRDKAGFIDHFTGDNRHITDFLLDEVLRSRGEEMQTWLLQISVLDRFCAPLCDALTGRSDSSALIDEMERDNLFIVELDQHRLWYRYHHLFSSLLQSRLRSADPAFADTLCRRASQWCDENDLPSEAIEYAFKAGDHAAAADLMEKHGGRLFFHSRIGTILRWAHNLPASLLAQRPALSLMCAWGNFYMDDLAEMGRHVRTAGACLDRHALAPCLSPERIMYGQLALARGSQCIYNGAIEEGIAQMREALESLPPASTLHKAAAVYLGAAYFVTGDFEQAQPLLEQHAAIAPGKHNPHVPITAALGLARLHLLRGNPAASRQIYHSTLREAHTLGLQDFPGVGMLHIGLGEVAYLTNAIAEAEQHLQRGVEITAMSMRFVNAWGRVLLAQTRLVAGAGAAAVDAHTRAVLDRHAGRFLLDPPPLSAAVGRLALHLHRSEDPAQWSDAIQLAAGVPLMKSGREAEYLVLARHFIASRQADRALELLDGLWPDAERGMRLAVMIEIEIFRALGLQAQERTCEALAALRRGVTLAEPTGLLRPFLDEGAGLRDLLTRLARGSDYTDHAHRLLSLIAAAPKHASTDTATPLCSLFSKKEKQIVSHIIKGDSNQEIAQALFISANTVNSHMKSIYGKLGVKSRLQAISRLRELGMSG